mmetsp:Transcript_34763/g.63260  ORF Transcript_34763/g.63260 Transcript_34763/m.63260 type:complete len:337 (-) Transcript_34763:259-1269(-)|eukprot:CAMPEP_0197653248 /NCGR_PEP_ID=MMETSP1338-20131121/34937_1 /TAXON_ID=43686 ORGANISM="Pelagodinium beii, Strain RCC1491" /NCGR_SAMPLE_ID=MMETSP1338 /ASSEMBLY_ACC=CAM_ASM_000754 /LENGTH=336 /DNA_ID=CAMNT_0043228289 /DNA_START=65 /DNA_END=1075 /DNA_ORIENTATION=-
MAIATWIACAVLVAAEESGFEVHKDSNTYNGWGSEDLDGDKMWSGRSSEDCMNLCMIDDDCDCAAFVDKDSWSYKKGDCFLRAKCDASKFQSAEGFEVFEKKNSTEDMVKKAKEFVVEGWDAPDKERLLAIKKDMSHPFYISYIHQNTHTGHGSHDLAEDWLWKGTTPLSCSTICTAVKDCSCAVYVHTEKWSFKPGDCFLRAACTPKHFATGAGGFEVLMGDTEVISDVTVHQARKWAVDNIDDIRSCPSGSQGCTEPAEKNSRRAKKLVNEILEQIKLYEEEREETGEFSTFAILGCLVGAAILVALVWYTVMHFGGPGEAKPEETAVLLEAKP